MYELESNLTEIPIKGIWTLLSELGYVVNIHLFYWAERGVNCLISSYWQCRVSLATISLRWWLARPYTARISFVQRSLLLWWQLFDVYAFENKNHIHVVASFLDTVSSFKNNVLIKKNWTFYDMLSLNSTWIKSSVFNVYCCYDYQLIEGEASIAGASSDHSTIELCSTPSIPRQGLKHIQIAEFKK